MPEQPILEVRGLTREFVRRGKPFPAVDDVNLTLDPGEFMAIVGRSGNGKSTLFNLVTGLLKPTSGSILLAGNEVTTLNDKQMSILRNRTIGFVFQGFNLLPRMTLEDNVALPLVYAQVEREERRAKARSMLARVGLDGYAQSLPARISGGQQQRVAIARALINAPSLILADEPTGNLDSHTSEEIMALFQELNAEGITIVLVTHDEGAVQALNPERVLLMPDGDEDLWNDSYLDLVAEE